MGVALARSPRGARLLPSEPRLPQTALVRIRRWVATLAVFLALFSCLVVTPALAAGPFPGPRRRSDHRRGRRLQRGFLARHSARRATGRWLAHGIAGCAFARPRRADNPRVRRIGNREPSRRGLHGLRERFPALGGHKDGQSVRGGGTSSRERGRCSCSGSSRVRSTIP